MVLRIKEEGSRYKMRELLVDTCTGEEEDGTAHSFQYYILVDEMELGGGLSCESYGVKVAGPDGEEASVPNITVSVECIDQLLELLRRNCVSPVTLRDVVLDWL